MTPEMLPPDALDLYIRGELSEAQKAAFEKQLAQDPALKAEVDMHESMVASLAMHRKQQLKTILQNTAVPVGVGIGLTLWQNSWIQWGLAAAGAGAVATGLWVATSLGGGKEPDGKVSMPSTGTTETTIAAPTTEAPQENAPATTEPTPAHTQEVEPKTQEAAPGAVPAVTPANKVAPITTQKKSSTVTGAPEKGTTSATTQTFDPGKLNAPDDAAPTIQSAGDNSGNAANLGSSPEASVSVAETVVKQDARYGMHYQYYEGKLYLYGKFDKGLYEVLDLTGKGSKRSFVFYQSTYYQVLPGTTQITPLEACKDQATIANLNKLRKGNK